ncbi:DUF6385 domain-containing protein [Evansella tamaricis]|uniref:DUF6385 domain-containing protein n=1 Tax=Evansella tamaricis TaxID=2069301 RepID=A0ABS6JLM0_9BACI|nr:DUF6385 domain-containing protein [Evansella tamaricis]MBU9713330.1 hypothetical protein [Evansella tamaricis]
MGGTIDEVTTVENLVGGTLNTVETILGGTIDEVTTVVSISQQNFVEDEELGIVVSSTEFTELDSQDSQFFKVYTFFVENESTDTVEVQLQISPNDSVYVDDSPAIEISEQADAIVPQKFGNYTRIRYRLADDTDDATLNVWFNAQG